jgi:hypothetical protein
MAHVVTHREFKHLFKGELFPTKHSVIDFNDRLVTVAADFKVHYEPFDSIDSQIRQVRFFDTADHDFRKNSVIFRLRRDQSGGWPDESWEITFKRRSPDYQKAADFDVACSIGLHEKRKFKEEILRGDGVGTLKRIFSNNNVLYSPVTDFTVPMSKIVDLFRGLTVFNFDPDKTVSAVNDARVFEIQAKLGTFYFAKEVVAHADLCVWLRPTVDAFNVLVAEFAFAYKVLGTSEKHQEGHEGADRFFKEMQAPFQDQLFTGSTKTALIYGVDEA